MLQEVFLLEDVRYDMSYPQYSVNDVSELTGISPYSIRYYDRIGLVSPKRNESGQRVYSYYDILDLTRRNHYKEMGFSLRETNQVLSAPPSEEILPLLESKKEEMREQRLFLEMAEHNLSLFAAQLKRLEFFLNKVSLLERSSSWHIPHSRDGLLCEGEASRKARSITGNSIYTFSFPEPAENGWEDCSDWDLTVESPYAERIGFDKIPGSFFVPGEICLYTIIGVPGTGFIKRQDVRILYDYAAENSLVQNGVIYGHDVINRTEHGQLTRYYEVWMPVRDPSTGI